MKAVEPGKREDTLLERLARCAECEYLSDIKTLTPDRLEMLRCEIVKIMPEEYPLRAWNDALEYLAGASPEQSSQAAQLRLIDLLSAP